MATAIIESIAANIKTTLDGVTTVGGFDNDLIVERQKTGKFVPQDQSVVIIQADTSGSEQPQDHLQWSQIFEMYAYVLLDEQSSTPIDQRINSMRSDIEKVLMVDVHRGDKALDTNIISPDLFEHEHGDYNGIIVRAVVKYRTLFADPYSQ